MATLCSQWNLEADELFLGRVMIAGPLTKGLTSTERRQTAPGLTGARSHSKGCR